MDDKFSIGSCSILYFNPYSTFTLIFTFLLLTGENRDQTVLNPEYLRSPDKLPLYGYFGKLLAIACRHSIMVPLSLPDLIWKPFVGESVDVTDLKATDMHTVRSLKEIADGRVSHVHAVELIMQALISSSICPKGGVLTSHPVASSVALKSFISPSDFDNNTDRNEKNKKTGKNLLPVHDIPFSPYSQSTGDSQTKNSDELIKKNRVKSICNLLLQDNLTQHRSGMDHFLKGIASVLPAEIFPIFTPMELKTIFCGQDEVDIEVLKRATVYEGGVGPTDRYINILLYLVEFNFCFYSYFYFLQ